MFLTFESSNIFLTPITLGNILIMNNHLMKYQWVVIITNKRSEYQHYGNFIPKISSFSWYCPFNIDTFCRGFAVELGDFPDATRSLDQVFKREACSIFIILSCVAYITIWVACYFHSFKFDSCYTNYSVYVLFNGEIWMGKTL